MRRFQRDDVSDEVAERLLSPVVPAEDAASPLAAITRELRAVGQESPTEAVTERHLAAIIGEVQQPREAPVGVAPRQVGRTGTGALSRYLPPKLAGGFTALTVLAALVVAGALPGPVQAAAADVLGVVGISVPDGRSVAKTDAEPTRPTVVPSGDSSPERNVEQPRRAHPAARHDDRDRLETPTTREADDGARGSRDDESDDSSGDGDERRPGGDGEPDDDVSDREPDVPEPDVPEDDDGSSGDGPSAGSIDVDEIDDSGSGSEDRSGPSDSLLPEPDSIEE